MDDRKTGYENARRSGSCTVAEVSTLSVECSGTATNVYQLVLHFLVKSVIVTGPA